MLTIQSIRSIKNIKILVCFLLIIILHNTSVLSLDEHGNGAGLFKFIPVDYFIPFSYTLNAYKS